MFDLRNTEVMASTHLPYTMQASIHDAEGRWGKRVLDNWWLIKSKIVGFLRN